ncbi:MAG: hypothetical protein E7491_09145 [Ruminococcaceae bacterium]|nr:hypothetical protein [Oscillospiraceae bacterium]
MKIQLKTIQDLYDFTDIANGLTNKIMVKRGNYIVPITSIMGLFVIDMTKEIELIGEDGKPVEVPELEKYRV